MVLVPKSYQEKIRNVLHIDIVVTSTDVIQLNSRYYRWPPHPSIMTYNAVRIRKTKAIQNKRSCKMIRFELAQHDMFNKQRCIKIMTKVSLYI